MEKEIWKSVKGYEGLYEISNHGRLKKLAKSWKCGWNTTINREESITLGNKNSYGYLDFDFCKNGSSKKTKIHRVVAQHFLPNPDDHRVINHIDGDKTNNHVSNLEWCSHKTNNEHAYINKLRKPKLTNEEVINIREMYATGKYSIPRLATLHNVHYGTIQCVVTRKTWKHI